MTVDVDSSDPFGSAAEVYYTGSIYVAVVCMIRPFSPAAKACDTVNIDSADDFVIETFSSAAQICIIFCVDYNSSKV